MKPLICIVAAVTMLFFTPHAQALFGHVAVERERRIEAQQQLDHQRQVNGRLYVATCILSVGIVVALLIGTAVGSKGRGNNET